MLAMGRSIHCGRDSSSNLTTAPRELHSQGGISHADSATMVPQLRGPKITGICVGFCQPARPDCRQRQAKPGPMQWFQLPAPVQLTIGGILAVLGIATLIVAALRILRPNRNWTE